MDLRIYIIYSAVFKRFSLSSMRELYFSLAGNILNGKWLNDGKQVCIMVIIVTYCIIWLFRASPMIEKHLSDSCEKPLIK